MTHSITRLAAMLALPLALCGPLAAPAFARDGDDAETKTLVVHYKDLDLATDAGAAKLRARVRWAVTLVCGDIDPADLAKTMRINQCRSAALNKAMPQVALALQSAHDGKALAAADDRAIAVPGS